MRRNWIPLFLAFAGTLPVTAQFERLAVGQPLDRELSAAAAVTYQINVPSDYFLRLFVEQQGIDVKVTLVSPDGNVVVDSDRPTGLYDAEFVSMVAEKGGDYRIQVAAKQGPFKTGRISVRIDQLRPEVAEDRARVAADRALQKGEQLRAALTAASLKEAIKVFEEAASLYHSAGETSRKADALDHVGATYFAMSDYRKALTYYDQSLTLFRSVADIKGESEVLGNIGVSSISIGDYSRARECLLKSLELRRNIGDKIGEAVTLSNIASLYFHLLDYDRSLQHLQQALEMHRALGNRPSEAHVLLNFAGLYQGIGKKQAALECSREGLRLARELGNAVLETRALRNIGAVYQLAGDHSSALEYHDRALAMAHKTGSRREQAYSLASISLARFYLRRFPEALQASQSSRALYHEIGDRRGEAGILNQIGRIQQSMSDPHRGREVLEQALTLARSVGDRVIESQSLTLLAATLSETGDKEKAVELLKNALDLRRATADPKGEAFTASQLARIERDRGNLDAAHAYSRQALDLVESLRRSLVAPQLRSFYLGVSRNYYELEIDLLMKLHAQQPNAALDAAALAVSERARARSLLELLSEIRSNIRQGVDPVLLKREESLRQRLSAASEKRMELLKSTASSPQIAALTAEIDTLTKDYDYLQGEIRSRGLRFAALSDPEPISAAAIQRLLDDDTMLLEYTLGDTASYVWAVTRNGLTTTQLQGRKDIESAASDLYRCLRENLDATAAIDRVSKLVIAPIAAQLNKRRIAIVADGALHYIPFSALSTSNGAIYSPAPPTSGLQPQPLIASHEVIGLPSASVLKVMREETSGRTVPPKLLAVIADPVSQRMIHGFVPPANTVWPPARFRTPARGRLSGCGRRTHRGL